MKNQITLFLLLFPWLLLSQESDVSLSTAQFSGTVVEATNSITLLPGFSTTGAFTAIIVEENDYSSVIGNPYNLNENLNWVSSSSYDLSGRLTSSGISYFNTLGKGTQSHSLDIKTGKIWANEVRYDEFGRPVFGTLSAPIGANYGYKNDFIKKGNGNTFSLSDLQGLTDNNSTVDIGNQQNTLGWYYSEANTSEKYQDVTAYPFSRTIYSTLNPGLGLRTLGGNKIQKTGSNQAAWLQSYSFTMPMAQEMFYAFGKDAFPERDLVVYPDSNRNKDAFIHSQAGYYTYTVKENCTGLEYSDVRFDRNVRLTNLSVYRMSVFIDNGTAIPDDLRPLESSKTGYFRVINSTFHPNNNGGDELFLNQPPLNPNEDIMLQGFSALLENTAYTCPSGRPYYIQGNKTVVRDVNGVESVVFTSSDGNVLAAARSGNEDDVNKAKYKVISPIGVQGYVDIHIPVGCSNATIKGPPTTNITVYDLITDQPVSQYINTSSKNLVLSSGMYRIKENTTAHQYPNPYATIDAGSVRLLDASNNIGVEYYVNYYDYSLNYYDKANRLTSSVQPLGFTPLQNNQSVQSNRTHTLTSTFQYNTLGQLLETESPDEGEAKFKYRKDGQIRFSQNSKQLALGEFSYTNYDHLGRPIESGVALGTFDNNLDPNAETFSSTSKKEQHFTLYDEVDATALNAALSASGISSANYTQTFIASNVSKTYTANPSTTTSWYSYDVYGRVQWIVQDIDGIGVKTIDYEYDFATGQVTKVLYQKHKTAEQFIHQYTYNVAGELFKVATSTDNSTFTEQAKYKYYETGALKRVEVAENVQGIDYIYNLNGQLKAINHPSRTASLDPGKDGTNGMPNDLFGFALDYYNGDYSRTNTPTPVTSTNLTANNQYNGNIKATRWSTNNIANGALASQVFTYNKNNWLQEANFGTSTSTGSITPDAFGNYKVSGLEYDINGNIKRLIRNKDGNASNAMDNLTYHYKTDKKNQLTHVTDAAGNVGVDDIGSQATGNYTYNSIGQLTRSADDSTDYIYNASGLVTEVKQNNITRVKFDYNDKGFRVKKTAYTSTGTLANETYYIRDAGGSPIAIYTPQTGVTSQASTEHPIYGASRLGVYNKNSNTSVYQFTDHLGNVRAVVGKTASGQVLTTANSATDYYPFGMPMPNRKVVNGEPYRYAYQGQEKDPETGKEAFQLRLWDGRIGRWQRPDPYRQYHSPYLGMGNIPTSAFDGDGGYVYIMGSNGKLLRIFNKVVGTEIGSSAISYFINNPRKHVIISAASTRGAGGVTTLYPRTLTEKRELTFQMTYDLAGALSDEDALKYDNHFNSFTGAVLQPGDNYLISIGVEKNSPHFNLEAAFHEFYAHAYLEENGIIDGTDQHFAIGGSPNGRLDNIGKPPFKMPDSPLPIQIFDQQLNNPFLNTSKLFGINFNTLKFGNTNAGKARRVVSFEFGEGNFDFNE